MKAISKLYILKEDIYFLTYFHVTESLHLQNMKLLFTFQTSHCVHFAKSCIGTRFIFRKQGINNMCGIIYITLNFKILFQIYMYVSN